MIFTAMLFDHPKSIEGNKEEPDWAKQDDLEQGMKLTVCFQVEVYLQICDRDIVCAMLVILLRNWWQ